MKRACTTKDNGPNKKQKLNPLPAWFEINELIANVFSYVVVNGSNDAISFSLVSKLYVFNCNYLRIFQ